MLIGDTVIYDGQAYTIVGFTPVSVTPAQLGLQPLGCDETFWIERQLLENRLAPAKTAAPSSGQAETSRGIEIAKPSPQRFEEMTKPGTHTALPARDSGAVTSSRGLTGGM